MIFHLTDEEINRICKACPAYGAGAVCNNNGGQAIITIRKCAKWNTFYGGKPCVRK